MLGVALVFAGAAAMADTGADTPKRVVSINLCTDQLALMLADKGQLISVTKMSQDPRSSAMAEAANTVPANASRAEEVFAMNPDLVLAGAYSSYATVQMLQRLGVRVEVFKAASSMAEIRSGITRMGAVLGQQDRATEMLAGFDAELARLSDAPAHRPRAALYFANGYTTGEATLTGQIVQAAGFANISSEQGFAAGGFLPLEKLALTNPDVVITGQPYRGASRAEAVMHHPVIERLKSRATVAAITDRDWVCGTPFVLRAVAEMRDLRLSMEPAK